MAVQTTAGHPASIIGPAVAGIDGLIAPARRRLALQVALSATLYGVAAGLAVAAALTGIAHLIGLDQENAPLWAAGAVAIGLLGGAAIGLSRRPSAGSVIALVDRRLGLQDRLVTSRELAAEVSPLARLQRHDTYAHLADVDTRRAAPWHPPIKEVACLVIMLLALLLAAWSPNPAAARSRQQAADHARVASAARAVQKAQARGVPAAPRSLVSAQELARRREIARIMANLQVKLAHANSVPAAVRAVSQTQDQLARLSTQVAAAQARALTALARSLPQQGATSALAHALQAGDPKKTAAALKALSKQVAGMSPAQKSALATTLEKAANSAAQAAGSASPQAGALRALASALAGNDKAGTQSALAAAASALSAAQAAAGAETATSQASQALEAIKRSLAGLSSPASAAAGAAAAGQGSAAGTAQDSGAAASSGSANGSQTGVAGNGSPGAGTGQGSPEGSPNGGQGAGAGQGAGSGNGSGSGTGGHGTGGGRGGAGAADGGKLERVYVPSKAGSGPSQTANGPSGPAAPGASRPYGQVLAQYSTTARSSLERGALPTPLQNAVKRYFSTLSK